MRMVSKNRHRHPFPKVLHHFSTAEKSCIAFPIPHPFFHQQPHAKTRRFIITINLRVLRLEDFRIETAAVGLQGLFVVCILLDENCDFSECSKTYQR
jgi:hypothetical protein